MISVDSFQEILSESSSRGNQHKFYSNGYWYKIDNPYCYEGLAEEFSSLVAECIYGFNSVSYRSVELEYNGDDYTGCMSQNMYTKDTQFISVRHIFKELALPLLNTNNPYNDMKIVVDVVGRATGLDIRWYLRDILYFDCLIINEDRHYMNLGICRNGNTYCIAPCFDNGSSLFCTNWTYRRNMSFEENIRRSRSVAKPFSKFFDRHVEALEKLGTSPLVIDKRAMNSLVGEYHNPLYSEDMNYRVVRVLMEMLKVYYNRVFIWG